jgi:hypothetical protein
VNPGSVYFTTPNTVTLQAGNTLEVYTSTGDVGIWLPGPIPGDITVIGLENGDANHYDILQQGSNDILWGYSGSAPDLTTDGAKLLLNVLSFLN